MPTIRTSRTSFTPNFSMTSAWIWPIKLSISVALPAPRGLTMKFECFSETRAPPQPRPFRPAASISRSARQLLFWLLDRTHRP